jgi:AraC family L-rhamnose operon regulatory protein RhaS
MTAKILKYYDSRKKVVYEADSCIPLRQAWEAGKVELKSLVRGTYPGEQLKKDEIPGVKSIGYWDIKKIQNWGLDWHTNEGIEICLLQSGNLKFLIKDHIYSLEANDITITRPWIIHKLGAPDVELSKLHWLILDVNVRHPHQQWQWPDWIVINYKDLDELTKYLRQNEQPVWKGNADFRNCFIQIAKSIKGSRKIPYDSKLRIQINNLLVILLDLLRQGNTALDKSLIESRRTVELFLKSLDSKLIEDWSIEKMAQYCHLGTTRFTHYCNEILNCSPMEYLNLLRLNRASELLLDQSRSRVIDIAYSSGFSSNHYFNYSFKRHFNTTPSQYRKSQIEKSHKGINEKQIK